MGEVRRRNQADQLGLSRVRTFPGASAGEGLAVRVGRLGDLIRERAQATAKVGVRSLVFTEEQTIDPGPGDSITVGFGPFELPDDGPWFVWGTATMSALFPSEQTEPGSGTWGAGVSDYAPDEDIPLDELGLAGNSGSGSWTFTPGGDGVLIDAERVSFNYLATHSSTLYGAANGGAGFSDAGYPQPTCLFKINLRVERLRT